MCSESISAYDAPERVRRYDADMDIMHPLRHKMVAVALEVLPFAEAEPLRGLDLGVGTGLFSQRLLERFPRAEVAAVDGAASMIELAKARLGPAAERVRFLVQDFRRLPDDLAQPGSLDFVVSSYALHHLTADEKEQVIHQCEGWLRPGGWFLNADLVVASDERVEARIQELRVTGVTERAAQGDERFRSAGATRAHLDELEAKEQDRPLPLAVDLDIARRAGLESVEVFWKQYREAVWGGPVDG